MDRLDDRSRLKEILRAHSVMRGEFTLASGQKSDIYVDCRLTTLRAEAMPLIGRLLLAAIREKGWRPRAVGGLTMERIRWSARWRGSLWNPAAG